LGKFWFCVSALVEFVPRATRPTALFKSLQRYSAEGNIVCEKANNIG